MIVGIAIIVAVVVTLVLGVIFQLFGWVGVGIAAVVLLIVGAIALSR